MAQHFLLSSAARSLSAAKVMRMSEQGAKTSVPACAGRTQTANRCARAVAARSATTAAARPDRPRWRCKACRADFSITSGTLFAWHKLPLRTYLMAIAVFCNEVKGKSMLAFSRELDVQYKTAFVLAHKLREAMASQHEGAAHRR